MNNSDKLLLGKCIRKYRFPYYTQEAFSKGICSKYTLSRLENDIPAKDIIYHNLLKRLGFYYNDNFKIVNITILLEHLIYFISVNDKPNILNTITSLEKEVNFYPTHILFLEYKQYINYLKIHYIEKKEIFYTESNISTLLYLNKYSHIVFMHVLCENMLFNNRITELHRFISLYYKETNNLLIDYFLTLYNQCNGFQIEAYTIFKKYKHILLEDHLLYQYIRFKSVIAVGYVNKEQKTAIQIAKRLEKLSLKLDLIDPYSAFIYSAFSLSNIKLNNYSIAFKYIIKGIKTVPSSNPVFLPYLIPLAILLNEELSEDYLIITHDQLSNLYIEYYYLNQTITHRRELLLFINRQFPKMFKHFHMSHPIPTLLRAIVIKLVDENYCYRSAIKFDALLKKYCK